MALIEEAERRHRHFFELLTAPARLPVWEPPVDIYLLEGVLHVLVAMPGVREDEVVIELATGALWVRAETRPPVPAAGARILRFEIPYGRMERRIELPPGHHEVLGQELQHGCVLVRLAGDWT